MTPPDTAGTPLSPLRYRRYFLWAALPFLLLYLLPFLLIRAPHFERWSASPFGRDLEYGITARNVDADVVIYGDSSALYGIDPVRMSHELGLKVFNIPNVFPSLIVTGDLGLRRYLQSNKPPRLIVIYTTAWNLDFSHAGVDAAYEGDEMLLRHGSAGELARFYGPHLTELLRFPFLFYLFNSSLKWSTISGGAVLPPATESTLGHRIMQLTRPLPDACMLSPAHAQGGFPIQTGHQLVPQYSSPQTSVMVYVAPMPACSNVPDLARERYAELPAAPPLLLPPSVFVDDDSNAHPLDKKVSLVTDLLVAAIRARLAPGHSSVSKPKP